MSEIVFEIDNSQLKKYNDKLRSLHRAAYPTAVRNTLNDLAFDVYKNTMPKKYDDNFIIRNKSFLHSHSGFKKATGWDVSLMQSQVGITPKESTSAEQLKHQEFGGNENKTAIYMDTARAGKSKYKLVTKSAYLTRKKYIRGDHANATRHTRKSNFVASAIIAQRMNTFLLWRSATGDTAFLIKGIRFLGYGRKRGVKINAVPVASVGNQNVNIKKKAFLNPASMQSYSKIIEYFKMEAEKSIVKYMNKK